MTIRRSVIRPAHYRLVTLNRGLLDGRFREAGSNGNLFIHRLLPERATRAAPLVTLQGRIVYNRAAFATGRGFSGHPFIRERCSMRRFTPLVFCAVVLAGSIAMHSQSDPNAAVVYEGAR